MTGHLEEFMVNNKSLAKVVNENCMTTNILYIAQIIVLYVIRNNDERVGYIINIPLGRIIGKHVDKNQFISWNYDLIKDFIICYSNSAKIVHIFHIMGIESRVIRLSDLYVTKKYFYNSVIIFDKQNNYVLVNFPKLSFVIGKINHKFDDIIIPCQIHKNYMIFKSLDNNENDFENVYCCKIKD